ncbi:MAG: lipid-A-disaccharide synthase [Syntrophorhabdaceae bacterium]|nr:lipid-A-disaccharide synthase [Syntrophorhabdales bacterium]MBP9560269.1 lipid-A-disaccharide synthase [Syntrophorhabdaceae bacterium]
MKHNPEKSTRHRIILLTGELSGELHSVNLIRGIKKYNFSLSGMGSDRLKEEGMEIVFDYRAISLMGISELLTRSHHILSALKTIKRHIRETKPILIILVDFPGFNLRIAEYAKRYDIPVIYFIPPQVWAWHKGRVYKIKKYVDLVLSILPFEKKFYEGYGVDVRYVGHPFAKTIKPTMTRDEFLAKTNIDKKTKVITIMPGSREDEISKHMPVLMRITHILKKNIEGLMVILPIAENIPDALIERFTNADHLPITLVRDCNHDALYHCDAAILASGSATLEAAILGAPTVVIYRVSTLSYMLAKMLVHVKYISLPNLIAGKEVFPEFIQHLDPEKIAEKVLYMLNIGRDGIKKDLDYIREEIGDYDSYGMAGDEIIRFLGHRYGAIS